MTEEDWSKIDDPLSILMFLKGRVTDRKLRLFVCGYCRLSGNFLVDERFITSVETSERYADGGAKRQALSGARRNAWKVFAKDYAPRYASEDVAWEAAAMTAGLYPMNPGFPLTEVRQSQQSMVLHDIFGPLPFRSIILDPHCLTPTIKQLAEVIYQERQFDRLGILADALEENGCTQQEVLEHLRSNGEHVRGCFALDLVLGKE